MLEKLQKIKTGATTANGATFGGYPIGRMVNISGLKSTGKTLLALEAMSCLFRDYPGAEVRYLDSEAAFDANYAEAIGMPVDRVDFVEGSTVERFSAELDKFVKEKQPGIPGMFILDSLDSLSIEKELETDLGDLGGYHTEKSKLIGIALRKAVVKIEKADICLFVIRQMRSKVGGYPGQTTKSGGHAPDYYASLCIDLKRADILYQTIKGDKRAYGVEIDLKVEKNKTGKPFRECSFQILFDMGIDDVSSCVNFLKERDQLERLPEAWTTLIDQKTKKAKFLSDTKDIVARIEKGDSTEEIKENRRKVSEITETFWNELEEAHKCKRVPKY